MRLNVDVRDDVYQSLCVFANADGRSISSVVRELILAWIQTKRDKLQVRMSPGVYEDLVCCAQQEGRTAAEVVDLLVTSWLNERRRHGRKQ